MKNTLIRLTSISWSLALGASVMGCRPNSSAGNDQSAVYGYLNGKHTFIVSHVFNADIYQNRLGQELSVAPELQSATNQFTCFYELQLTPQELNQCGNVTGVPGYTDPSTGQLTEKDVWRLMVLKQAQTTALTNVIIPVRVLHAELKQDWAENPTVENTAATLNAQATEQLTSQTQTTSLNLAAGNPQMQFIGFDTILSVGAGLLGNLLNRNKDAAANQATNSAACLVAQRTAKNPLQELTGSFLSTLGNKIVGDNPNPVVTVITGTALGFLNNIIGNVISGGKDAQQEASDRCAREVVTAAAAAENGTTIPVQVAGVNTQSVIQAANAVNANDTEALKKILEAETTRVIEAMQAENFQMSSSLKDAMYNLNEKNFHTLRVNIQNLSNKLGSQMNGSACLPPSRFVTDVLKMALSEKTSNIDSAENLNRIAGCQQGEGTAVQSAAPTPTVEESGSQPSPASTPVTTAVTTEPTATSTPTVASASPAATPTSSPAVGSTLGSNTGSTIQSGQPPITTTSQNVTVPEELRRQIAELEKKIALMNERLNQNSGSNTVIQSAQTNSGFDAIKQKYASIAPETCFSSSYDFKSLSAEELDSKRLAFCKDPLSPSTSKDTFAKFPKELREKCVSKSVDTLAAKATCLCSCRWDTTFYQRLQKE